MIKYAFFWSNILFYVFVKKQVCMYSKKASVVKLVKMKVVFNVYLKNPSMKAQLTHSASMLLPGTLSKCCFISSFKGRV